MEKQKMTLDNMQGKLNRTEMKKIKGGDCNGDCYNVYTNTMSNCFSWTTGGYSCGDEAQAALQQCMNNCGELPY